MNKTVPPVADETPGQRTFQLHARFTPKGPKKSDFVVFQEFWLCTREHLLQQENAKLALRRAAMESAPPRTGKSPSHRSIKTGAASGHEELAALDLEIAALDLEGAILDKTEAARAALTDLMELAVTGNAEAATSLVDLAQDAAFYLQVVEKALPGVMARIARARGLWTVLATSESGWEEKALKRITALGLGEHLRIFKVRFRQARGDDANLPPRLWAKAAVRVIEDCRWRHVVFWGLMDKAGSAKDLHDLYEKLGWHFGPSPKWADEVMKLPPFSKNSLSEWKAVVRQMIRQELPDFHLHKDWANHRRRAEDSGLDSPGELRNAILDDIVSALRRIAPEAPC